MSIVGLDHVQVAAPRVEGVEEQARAFYGGLLGLQELEKPDALKPKGGVWFSLGRGELHVGLVDQFNSALLVNDLPALRRRLEEAGLAIAQAEPIPGVSRFYVSDPFGNRIELMERL
ncbi:MAG: glyoxalase [Chloroflexota bacterium]|nr:glyoxalase [Chloroflexota bacterium]